jgi:AcrR family transcriptional regulator
MATRKGELLDDLIRCLQRRGLSDLSLRPMAAEIGTSARLLLFHFGSKERLLESVLEEMQARLRRSLEALLTRRRDPRRAPLRVFWDWAMEAENFPALRLLYQLHLLATQSPERYGRYLDRNARSWLDAVQAALPPEHRDPILATLITAVFDGLFIEVMSSGDRRRATRALEEFIRLARRDRGRGSRRRGPVRPAKERSP